MTLSSLFQKPALTTLISGGVTDSVVTSSPAILLGFIAGGASSGTIAGSNAAIYQFTIKKGTTIITNGISNSAYPTSGLNQLPSGIDCPNGIQVTVAKRYSDDTTAELANARLTIFYVLK
jgi:ABC-type uncharacterized transport system permease subunit